MYYNLFVEMFFEAIFRTLLYHIQIKVQEKFKFCSVFEVAKKGNCENLFFFVSLMLHRY